MKTSSLILAAALFSSSSFAQRIVNCPLPPPATPLIQMTTNSQGQMCWFVNDNLAQTPGKIYLDCFPNKPMPMSITGPAYTAKIDYSYITNGSTYILCYYPTNPPNATPPPIKTDLNFGELWVRLEGKFIQTGPTEFTELSSGTPPPSAVFPQKQVLNSTSDLPAMNMNMNGTSGD